MYNQAAINSLPNAEQRITIRKYLDCAFCAYIIYGILQILGIVASALKKDFIFIGHALWALIYLMGGFKCSELHKLLSQTDLNLVRVKASLEYTFCLNMVVMVIKVLALIGVVIALLISLNDAKDKTSVIAMVIGYSIGMLLFWILPFYLLLRRHPEVKAALNFLFSANSAPPDSGLVPQFGSENNGYKFDEESNQPPELAKQQVQA